MRALKRFAVAVVGFGVVALGIVLMPLPGPGMLIVLAGVLILATQFQWAARRVDQVKRAALRGAADSVKSWPRIVGSVLFVIWLVTLGVVWGLHPPAPDWWPLSDSWWLRGGWWSGGALVFSGLFVGGTLVYSYRHFREIKDPTVAEEPAVDGAA